MAPECVSSTPLWIYRDPCPFSYERPEDLETLLIPSLASAKFGLFPGPTMGINHLQRTGTTADGPSAAWRLGEDDQRESNEGARGQFDSSTLEWRGQESLLVLRKRRVPGWWSCEGGKLPRGRPKVGWDHSPGGHVDPALLHSATLA